MSPRRRFEAGTGSAPGATRPAPIARLRPIRMLVISPDRGYHERATAVLSELGPIVFAVTTLAEPGDVSSLVVQERADVVLLDATGCESAARRVIAALADASPRTGIVAVCHHCTHAAHELGALPKWGWTQDLRDGVERAYREGNPLSPLARSGRRRTPWQRPAGPLPGR